MVLYDHPLSGNCHKVRLLVSMLRLPCESVFVDVLSRANRSAGFLAMNPLGQIPVIADDDVVIRDAQAVLVYLASRYAPEWVGQTPLDAARVVEWLSFAANEIGSRLQLVRLYHLAPGHVEGIDVDRLTRRSLEVLGLLDRHLQKHRWLACDRPTIADLACFPYVGLAREGRLRLDDYAHVLSWIDRIAALPGYVAMPGLPGAASLVEFGDLERVQRWTEKHVSENSWRRFCC